MHRHTNFIKISRMVAEISLLTIVQNYGCLQSWIFKNSMFLTAGKLWRTNICHRTKFQQNRPDGWLLVSCQVEWTKMHHLTNFLQNRSNGSRDSAFNIFQNRGHLLYCICVANFGTTHNENLMVFITVQNLVIIVLFILIIQ